MVVKLFGAYFTVFLASARRIIFEKNIPKIIDLLKHWTMSCCLSRLPIPQKYLDNYRVRLSTCSVLWGERYGVYHFRM